MKHITTNAQTEPCATKQNNLTLSVQTAQQLNCVCIANDDSFLMPVELTDSHRALAQMKPAPLVDDQQLQQQIQQFALDNFESNWQYLSNL